VTVGVWKGTEVGLSYGGTGASSASQARGNILPSYSGNAGKVLAVNVGATDAEWIAAGGSGTVTSVAVSGGTTGLTTSGGPITAAGTITLAGTLAVANGGTGVTTSTGSGNAVLSNNPTLVTPILGTPQSGNFSTGTFTWPTFNQNTTGTAAGLSATLAVASGGTGATSLTANNVILGNGTSAVQTVAPGANGNVLTSNGTTWTSATPSSGGITTGKSIAMAMIFGF
jgi:hypothetical protein